MGVFKPLNIMMQRTANENAACLRRICPAGKSWPNHVKNEQHIGSKKTFGPKNTEQLNIMISMQRTANGNAAVYVGSVKDLISQK